MASEFNDPNLRRMSDAGMQIADGEPDVRGWDVRSASGEDVGQVRDLIVDTSAMKVRYLEVDPRSASGGDSGATVFVPIADAELNRDDEEVVLEGAGELNGTQLATPDLSSSSTSSDSARGTAEDDVRRLTRAEEEVRIGKRAVQTGEVRVGKHVETEHVHEDVSVMRERVHVERRPVTDASEAGDIRASAEELRVPIVEEELVVEKRPVVKEELVISKERVHETAPVDAEVRREEFDIDEDRTRVRDDAAEQARRRGGA